MLQLVPSGQFVCDAVSTADDHCRISGNRFTTATVCTSRGATVALKSEYRSDHHRLHMVVKLTWLERLDNWRMKQPGYPTRSQAVRHFVDQGLNEWDRSDLKPAIDFSDDPELPSGEQSSSEDHSKSNRRIVTAPGQVSSIRQLVFNLLIEAGEGGLRPASATKTLEERYFTKMSEGTIYNEMIRLWKLGIARRHRGAYYYVVPPDELPPE